MNYSTQSGWEQHIYDAIGLQAWAAAYNGNNKWRLYRQSRNRANININGKKETSENWVATKVSKDNQSRCKRWTF